MENIKLRISSEQGIEASIECDGSQGGVEDYYSIVSVNGFMTDKKVYGVDPLQAFSLGMGLIAQLTEGKRLEEEAHPPMNGSSWRIEVES